MPEVPKVAVKADGTDQKVTGHPHYDTVAVHVVIASSVEIIEKKDGKIMYTDNESISADDTIEETDKRDGKIVGVYRLTVSKDGKSIKAEYTDKQPGTTMAFTMERQS